MPVLKKKIGDETVNEWYIQIPNKGGNSPPVFTLQVEPEGHDLLLNLDLDHSPEKNQSADIEWDIFQTLSGLGLVYTSDSDYEPGGEGATEKTLENVSKLSDSQRAMFAQSLLDKYSLVHLCSNEHTFEFLLSLQSLAEPHRHDVLGTILEETPFDVDMIDSPGNVFEQYAIYTRRNSEKRYDPFSLAIISHIAYEAWDDPGVYNSLLSSNEGRPVWVWEDWVAMGGTELMYISGKSELLDMVPAPVFEVLVGESRSVGAYVDFFAGEFSALCAAQTVAKLSLHRSELSEFVRVGFTEGNFCMILPRPENHNTDTPGEAISEASTPAK